MKLSQWFAGIALTSALACAGSAQAGSEEWEKVNEKDGIQVSVRNVPGTSLVAVRGEAELDAPPGKVLQVIMDCGRAKEWVDHLKECRRVRQFSDYEYVTHNHFGTPFVMKDRDFVARVKITVDLKAQAVQAVFRSIEDADAPPTDAIRGNIIESKYQILALDGGKRSRMVGEALVDPKGSVPKWIVNFFQRQWPVTTIKSLRKQVAKSDIVVPPFFQNLLAAPAASPSAAPVSASK